MGIDPHEHRPPHAHRPPNMHTDLAGGSLCPIEVDGKVSVLLSNCARVYVYVCMYMCECVRVCACVCVSVRVRARTYAYARVCVCVCVCVVACVGCLIEEFGIHALILVQA